MKNNFKGQAKKNLALECQIDFLTEFLKDPTVVPYTTRTPDLRDRSLFIPRAGAEEKLF